MCEGGRCESRETLMKGVWLPVAGTCGREKGRGPEGIGEGWEKSRMPV